MSGPALPQSPVALSPLTSPGCVPLGHYVGQVRRNDMLLNGKLGDRLWLAGSTARPRCASECGGGATNQPRALRAALQRVDSRSIVTALAIKVRPYRWGSLAILARRGGLLSTRM